MVTELGQMLLDATITFLNFGLAKAEGFQRGFQSKEQGLVPTFGNVLEQDHRPSRAGSALVNISGLFGELGAQLPVTRRFI